MKQNRYTPFGYLVQNGKIQISPVEAAAVRQIFDRYLSDESYQQIADGLNVTTIRYSPQGCDWNKHMVKRVLENERLCGTAQCAAIIESDTFQQANALRQSKTIRFGQTPKTVLLIAKKVECASCGKPIVRHTKSAGKPKWVCTGGCHIRLTDEIVMDQMKVLLQAEMIATPPSETDLLTVKRLKNELNREWDKTERDEQQLRQLIFEVAAAEYALCDASMPQRDTTNKGFDSERFLRITQKLLYLDGQLTLLTKSGQIVSLDAERSETK